MKTSARVGYPLWNDQPYDFKVVAANAAGQSSATNVVRGGPRLPPPQAPTALAAQGYIGYVFLDWNPSSTGNVLYWVWYRKLGTSSWHRARYPVLTTSLIFKYVPWGDYEFKVIAANRAGVAESNHTSATLWTTKRSLVYLMTLNTQSSRDMFWSAQFDSRYDSYNFDFDTDYCSFTPTRPWVLGAGFPQRVDFTRPCARHDFGYGNYPDVGWTGYSKKRHVDWLFFADMYHECDRQLPGWQYNSSCHGVAKTYYKGVRVLAHM